MSEHPSKPSLTPIQRETLILENEIKADNARIALKTYKKERLEIQTKLANIEVSEKRKQAEIAEAEATIQSLQQEG